MASGEAAELLQKLSLDSPNESLSAAEPTKKQTPQVQYAPVDRVGNGVNNPVERSTSPFLDASMFYNPNVSFQPDLMDPSMFYHPNGYQSTYYYGGNEWDRYVNTDGVEMPAGVYGDFQQGYGYYPYGPYQPSGSTMGHDGQMYGAQHYQYPTSYLQSSATNTASRPYTPGQTPTSQSDITGSNGANRLPLPVEGTKVSQGSVEKIMGNHTHASKHPITGHPNSYVKSNRPYGSGGLPQASGISSSVTQGNNGISGRNNQSPSPHLMGLQHPRATTGLGQPAYISQMYPNSKAYGQYTGTFRSSPGFMSGNYYPSRINGCGWLPVNNKFKFRNHSNGNYGYNKETMDGLTELNRGPRSKGLKDQKDSNPVTLAVKGQSLPLKEISDEDNLPLFSDMEQYNGEDFPETYEDAKFFVIKSYSEDDVHKCIKYGVWTSTPNGNKKLDAAYKEAQEKSGGCPVFLLFSVNASGQFVGLAEMVGPVDFERTVGYWQQDKWSGCFPVRWHMVKDLPNSMLRHITLENNENKPVTNSRDTQEVKLEQGVEIIKIMKRHSSKTCILEDFEFYEGRQKVMQEKKSRQRQSNKQSSTVKLFGALSTDNEGNEASADLTTVLNGDQKAPDGDPKLLEENSSVSTTKGTTHVVQPQVREAEGV